MEYDCILNRVTSVVLGQFQSNYIDNIGSSVDKIDSVINSEGDIMAERVKGILDGMNTQLRLQSTVAKKVKGRAFTIEDLDPDSPLFGCMTWGTQGFRIANRRTADNRDWDWRTAATANGFFADAIVTGTLADRTGTNYWDLDKGIFKIASKSLSVDGQSVETLIQATEKEILITAEQNAKDYVDGKLVNYSTSAQIKVETDLIKQTVSKKVDGNKIISFINQSPETVKILPVN